MSSKDENVSKKSVEKADKFLEKNEKCLDKEKIELPEKKIKKKEKKKSSFCVKLIKFLKSKCFQVLTELSLTKKLLKMNKKMLDLRTNNMNHSN